MRRKTIQQPLSLLLCTFLLLNLLSGCGQGNQGQSPAPAGLSGEDAVQPIDPAASSTPAGSKEETVYIKADPDGSVEKITSEVLLKEPGDAALVRDVSTLRDIRNTVGDEEYLLLEDGTLLWENHGEDIHYKGTASGDLPVTVKITYWLDGQMIAPEQLAGKSGKVRIRFGYENHTRQTVATKDGEVSVCTPFAALTMVMLSGEHFSNVEVKNGRLMDLDGESAVIGLALPGLSESLSLSQFEPTEEIELPEFVELTADVTEFELEFTATVITPGLLDEVKPEDLDKLNQLREDMVELQDATDELTDGVGELSDGAGAFGDYLAEYTDGAGQISDGAKALAQGLEALNQQVSGIAGQVDAWSKSLEGLSKSDWMKTLEKLGEEQLTLPDGTQMKLSDVKTAAEALIQDETQLQRWMETLETALESWENYAAAGQKYAVEVSDALSSIPSDLTEQVNQTAREQVRSALGDSGMTEDQIDRVADSIDLSQLTDPVDHARKTLEALTVPVKPEDLPDGETIQNLAANLQTNMALLQTAAEALSQQAGDLSDWEDVVKDLTALAETDFSPSELADGAKQLAEGISQLSDGANALSDGAKALKTAGSAMNQGYDGLKEGIDALKEGVEKYNKEGISQLTDLTGEGYQTLLRQLWGLKETDGSYNSFSGLGDGAEGSVRFIIETDKIG